MTIEDLLADESFISYCKQDNRENILRWENYIRDNPEQESLIANARLYYSNLFYALAMEDRDQQEAVLISRLAQTDEPPVVQMKNHRVHGRRKIIQLLLKVSGVAAAALVLTYFLLPRPEPVNLPKTRSFVANFGERKNFQLPDGSIVMLNAGSRVEILGTYGLTTRDIYLEGEAYFDVKHNTTLPFIVHTEAMDIKALGTAFNVKAYAGEKKTETSLIRGRVEITLKKKNDEKVILEPNKKVYWDKETPLLPEQHTPKKNIVANAGHEGLVLTLQKTDLGDLREVGWIDNKLIFNDDALQDIAVMLERWYGIHVEFGDEVTKNYRFTGTFEKESLKMVLDVLKESKKFHYEELPGNPSTIRIVK